MNRKEFLAITLLGIGKILAKNVVPFLNSNNFQDPRYLGIITNTFRRDMEKNPRNALKLMADIGYKYIEGGVPDQLNASEYRSILDENKLKSIALGGGIEELQSNLDNFLETANILGSKYIICYWPWLSSEKELDIKAVENAASRLNSLGKRIHQSGINFAWHNHDREFTSINNTLVFDLLMEKIDPQYTTVQLDWYWAAKAGQDPVQLFKKYPGRFELAHVKDMNNNNNRGITCAGNGIIDLKRIVSNAELGGVKYFIVENEQAVDGLACAKGSYNYLKGILNQ